MSAKLILHDALILAKKGQPVVRVKISDKTGEKTASFSVGIKVYDSSYAGNVRYNNFYVAVPTSLVDKVERLKLKDTSMVHIIADFDYTKDVLAPKEQQGDIEAEDYGRSRLVNGVICRLIDIEFAGTSSRAKHTSEASIYAKDTSSGITSKTEIGSKAEEKWEPLSSPTAIAVTTEPNESIDINSIERELGIDTISLDEQNIFCPTKQPTATRNFFQSKE